MTATKTKAAAPLDEIREMVVNVLPPLPVVTAGGESLGSLAPVWRWLAAVQGKSKPDIRHPRIALFAAAHGAAPEQTAPTGAAMGQLAKGKHALSAIALESNADLQVYELNLDDATPVDDAAAAHAISYGLMAVQPGIDLLCLAALNPAAETAGEKIIADIKKGAAPLAALVRFGGLDICAMTGALAAARLSKTPVLLDGAAALAAAAVLKALRADAADHARDAGSFTGGTEKAEAGVTAAVLAGFLKSLAKAS